MAVNVSVLSTTVERIGKVTGGPGALRRQIGLLGTISLSVGVMAPTLAMSLTGVQAAALIGRAAPLVRQALESEIESVLAV
jgi:hypothetical protein